MAASGNSAIHGCHIVDEDPRFDQQSELTHQYYPPPVSFALPYTPAQYYAVNNIPPTSTNIAAPYGGMFTPDHADYGAVADPFRSYEGGDNTMLSEQALNHAMSNPPTTSGMRFGYGAEQNTQETFSGLGTTFLGRDTSVNSEPPYRQPEFSHSVGGHLEHRQPTEDLKYFSPFGPTAPAFYATNNLSSPSTISAASYDGIGAPEASSSLFHGMGGHNTQVPIMPSMPVDDNAEHEFNTQKTFNSLGTTLPGPSSAAPTPLSELPPIECEVPGCSTHLMRTQASPVNHFRDAHPGLNRCPWSDCTGDAGNLGQHVFDKHCGVLYSCPFCLKNFGAERAAIVHIRKNCPGPSVDPVTCGWCQLPWKDTGDLHLHLPTCESLSKLFHEGRFDAKTPRRRNSGNS